MMTAAKNELTIVRVLDAPREKVWRACREPGALREWWGQPRDATMPVCHVDFRVGGALHFAVDPADGARIWFKCLYREIVEGEKLVLEQYPSDAHGNALASARWPASTITLRFEDLDGKTKLTVVHSGMVSEVHSVDDYREGWSQSLDRLADSLARH